MENEKKSLQVNAAICDMREISEEVLAEKLEAKPTEVFDAPIQDKVVETPVEVPVIAKSNFSIDNAPVPTAVTLNSKNC